MIDLVRQEITRFVFVRDKKLPSPVLFCGVVQNPDQDIERFAGVIVNNSKIVVTLSFIWSEKTPDIVWQIELLK
jgi:hypothetical protein